MRGWGGGRGALTNTSLAKVGRENTCTLFRILRFLPVWIVAFRFFFSRVSQEEVGKWAESLESLISHECTSDHALWVGVTPWVHASHTTHGSLGESAC